MLGHLTFVQVAMATLYGAIALIYVAAAMVWVCDWLHQCRGFAENPESISPIDRRALAFSAAAAVGMFAVLAVSSREPGLPWTQLLFSCIMLGLAFNCLQYLLRWNSGGAVASAYMATAGLGAVIAVAPTLSA